MSNYRRLISYIYAYEGGNKGKNIGFAKIEARNGQCKIQVSVKKVYVGNNDMGVYLLAGSDQILLGKIFIRNGAGEFRAVVSVGDVENSGWSMDQCYGLTIHSVEDSWQSYTTIWDDAVTQAAELQPGETVETDVVEQSAQMVLGDLTTESLEAEKMAQIPGSSISEETVKNMDEAHRSSIVQEIEAEIQAQSRADEEELEERLRSEIPEPVESDRILRPGMDGEQDVSSESIGGGMEEDESEEMETEAVRLENREKVPPSAKRKGQGVQETPSRAPVWTPEMKGAPSPQAVQKGRSPQGMKATRGSTMGQAGVPENQAQMQHRTPGTAGMPTPAQQGTTGVMIPNGQNMQRMPERPVPPIRPTVPVRPAPPIMPASPVQPPQPTRSEAPTQPTQPVQQPSAPVQQPQPIQQPSASVQQSQPIHQPSAPVQPLQPIQQPVTPSTPVQPSQSVTPSTPAQPAQSCEQGTPTQPSSGSMQMQPGMENQDYLNYLAQEEMEACPPDWLWQHFRKCYPKIQAFDYVNGCEILMIKPQDIGLLPRETWTFGNNSFLLHGFYSFRYLILVKLNNPEGNPRFLLGVPGHYYSNEKYMASMFGFPNFVLSKLQPEGDTRFGYWYTDINMGNQ